jgi:hypothetical protein
MAPFFRQTPSGQAKRIGLTTTTPAPTTSREYVIPIGTIRGYRAYNVTYTITTNIYGIHRSSGPRRRQSGQLRPPHRRDRPSAKQPDERTRPNGAACSRSHSRSSHKRPWRSRSRSRNSAGAKSRRPAQHGHGGAAAAMTRSNAACENARRGMATRG